MTQQSLITRLKAVEKALVTEIAEFNASMYERDIDCDHEGKCNRVVGCLRVPVEKYKPHLVATLSDLRELIKEAEGQVETAAMFPDGFVAKPDDLQFCQHRSGQVVHLLYTALGEKP